MEYSLSDVGHACTAEEYASQYDTAHPEIGKNYFMHLGCWMEQEVTILYKTPDGRYFIAQEVGRRYGVERHGIHVFYAQGAFIGWRCHDTNRPSFRLRNKET